MFKPTFAKRSDKAGSSGQADPSIRPRGDLTIGYAHGGARPQSFELTQGVRVEVSYVKFLLTTEYVDRSHIEQVSPFSESRKGVTVSSNRKLWDTALCAVVQKA